MVDGLERSLLEAQLSILCVWRVWGVFLETTNHKVKSILTVILDRYCCKNTVSNYEND